MHAKCDFSKQWGDYSICQYVFCSTAALYLISSLISLHLPILIPPWRWHLFCLFPPHRKRPTVEEKQMGNSALSADSQHCSTVSFKCVEVLFVLKNKNNLTLGASISRSTPVDGNYCDYFTHSKYRNLFTRTKRAGVCNYRLPRWVWLLPSC